LAIGPYTAVLAEGRPKKAAACACVFAVMSDSRSY